MPGADTQIIRDSDRLKALQRCMLLDTDAEAAFDRLTNLASRVIGAPISAVSLVDAQRQFFKSKIGLDIDGTPLSHSFCQHVVAAAKPLAVDDARRHPLLKDNLAIRDLNAIGYLGMPLTTSDGYDIGTLCVIDHEPREWSEEEISLLQELADTVMMEIELRLKLKIQEQVGATIHDDDLYSTLLDERSGDTKRFGIYRVRQTLGRGGMCQVFECEHEVLGLSVAVKRLLDMHYGDPDFTERFRREATIVSSLKHPNIIRVFDFGFQDNAPYMVMEYIKGMTLADFMATQQSIPLKQALPILYDIAGALDHAHAKGVVHRDIKPSNIMLRAKLVNGQPTNQYQATLMDFGIATIVGTESKLTDDSLGTLDYISPEQIEDARTVDHRADIYSLAVVAFEMLTGRLPFETNSVAQLIYQHLDKPAPDARDINPALPVPVAYALQRALSKDKANRFDSAGEFTQALSVPAAPAARQPLPRYRGE